MATASNSAKLDPRGFIDITVTGDQTYESFDSLYRESGDMVDQLRKAGKPPRALIDVSKETGYDLGSNKAAMNALESTEYEKTAIVGAKGPHKEVTRLIILAMGKNDSTRMFEDRASALAWLFEK